MKKKILTIALVVVLAFAALATAACSHTYTKDDLFAVASFKEGETGALTVALTIKSGDETVAAYDGAQWTCVSEAIDFEKVNFAGKGNALKFESSMFGDETFDAGDDTAEYRAKIVDVQTFLGDADATDATVVVKVDVKNNKLISTEIAYATTRGGIAFQVAITVKA